jgi:periplasmic protein TonB
MRADVFEIREPWGRPFAASAVLHTLLFGGIFIYATYLGHMNGENWGGATAGQGTISATLVSSAAIPLPQQPVPTENIVANESPGLTQSQPKVEPIPEPEAIPIPEQIKPKPKQKPPVVTENKPRPVQQATNVVPFGQGGPVRQNYATFNSATGVGGLNVGTGGDFGSRYSWYVETVRRVVSQNWMKYEVDPHVTTAERVYVIFDIVRNGQPVNVQVEKSSGIPSLDQSAVRALQRIDTFGPLPNDYSGNRVAVEFYFDYKRQ